MRIALVVPYYDPRTGGDAALALWRHPTVPELAAALSGRGHTVKGFHLARRSARAAWAGAAHAFVPTGPARRAIARAAWRLAPRFMPPYYELGLELATQVRRWRPEIVHVFGLNLDVNLALAALGAARAGGVLVIHFHGGQPADDRWTRRLQRATLRRAARVLFTHADQALPWREAGLLRTEQIVVIPETSTRMGERPATPARRLAGRPACLAVGRLHPIKDIPTLLAAFARVADALPEARLHLHYGLDAYAGRLHALVRAVPCLAQRVVFHGYTKSMGVRSALAGADVFVQASRREWSGLSVLEALAVGCPAVLSDLPALRSLTDDGRVARLVPVGAAESFAEALVALAEDSASRTELADAGRKWFQERLSFEAIARDVEDVYRSALSPPGADASAGGRRSGR